MYKLKNIYNFVLESSVERAKERLSKAKKKSNNFQNKLKASTEEVSFRKSRVEYEQEKERLQKLRDESSNKLEKEKIKEKLRKLKDDWKEEKDKSIEKIRRIRNI